MKRNLIVIKDFCRSGDLNVFCTGDTGRYGEIPMIQADQSVVNQIDLCHYKTMSK